VLEPQEPSLIMLPQKNISLYSFLMKSLSVYVVAIPLKPDIISFINIGGLTIIGILGEI